MFFRTPIKCLLQISQLNETLQRKEVEIHGMEERYKRYIEKAKSVIRTLDPKGVFLSCGK